MNIDLIDETYAILMSLVNDEEEFKEELKRLLNLGDEDE